MSVRTVVTYPDGTVQVQTVNAYGIRKQEVFYPKIEKEDEQK